MRKEMYPVIYYCQHCHYTFTANALPERCPDCGKVAVRPASEEERAEYDKVQAEITAEKWDDCAEH